MKVRQNFVSNSSSASYTVVAEIDRDTLCATILRNTDICKESFKESLEESLKFYTERLADKEDKASGFYNSESYAEKKLEIEEKLKRLKKYDLSDSEDLFKYMLDVLSEEHITLKKDFSEKESWEISCWTTMHNSYGDMNNFFKDIVISLNFEGDFKVTHVVQHDG